MNIMMEHTAIMKKYTDVADQSTQLMTEQNEITKRLPSDTLAKTLGVTLYKEREKIESMIRERVPFLKHAKGLEVARAEAAEEAAEEAAQLRAELALLKEKNE